MQKQPDGAIQEWFAAGHLNETGNPVLGGIGQIAHPHSLRDQLPDHGGGAHHVAQARFGKGAGLDLRFWPIGWIMHALFMRRALKKALPQGPEAVKTRVETGQSLRDRRAPRGQPQLKPALV